MIPKHALPDWYVINHIKVFQTSHMLHSPMISFIRLRPYALTMKMHPSWPEHCMRLGLET